MEVPQEDSQVTVSSELSVRVLRCTCGHPENHTGLVCPKARVVDLGTIAYWHRNPLKRFWIRLTKGVYKRNFLSRIGRLTED